MTQSPVRWGFLGAGMVATTALAPAVAAADGAVLHAVGARDLSRARALGPACAYDSYEAVLRDPAVEAVYISLPNDAHLPWVLAALRAGKHVLCEKPLALDAAQVDEMAAAARSAGLLLVEASWYRWHPRTRLAQARLPEVGAVRHVTAGFTFAGELDGNYRLEPARGGGALYDVGCYAVSACLWAVGQGLPADVVARSSNGPTGVDLDTRLILDWPSGAQAEVHVAMATATGQPPVAPAQWLVLTGERGEVELRGSAFTAWTTDDTELWISDGAGTERIAVAAVDAYRLMVQEVSSVLRGGPGWVLPHQESRQCAAVLDAARASAASGGSPVCPA